MQRRQNILLLLPTFADAGGTQKLLSDLGEVLAERHNVFECSFDAARERRVFPNENPVLSLDVPPRTSPLGKLFGYVLKAWRLNRLKKRHRIDITISNLWPADLINALSLGPGLRLSHGIVNVIGNQQNSPLEKYRWAVGWLYRRFHMTVAINSDLMEELTGLFQLQAARTACIHAFVKLPERTGPEIPSSRRRRIAWQGRLHRMKNLTPMFEIVRRVKEQLPEVQLLVIGDGPHRAALIDEARQSGLSVEEGGHALGADVCFVGFVPDPFPYLRGSEVFVLSSRSEGFGLVIVEAMSVGLPVLASDCPTGGPHLIMGEQSRFRHGRVDVKDTPYGALLPVPDERDASTIDHWSQALVTLLTDDGLRTEKGERAATRAQDFSRERLKASWFSLLDSLSNVGPVSQL